MRILLLSFISMILAANSSFSQVACNTFGNDNGLSEWDPNTTISYSVSNDELVIDLNGAVLWGQNEVKWDFPSALNLSSAVATGMVTLEISVSTSPALSVSGSGCGAGTNYLPIGLAFYDGSNNYSQGFQTTESAWSDTYTAFSANFSTWQTCNSSAVTGISIKPADPGNGCTSGASTVTGQIKIKNLKINTSDCTNPTTSAKTAALNLSLARVYPNPVSDRVVVELELKNSAQVKVTLTDLMGKEVKVIKEGELSSFNESFQVSNFQKGMYTINYMVDGSVVKAEMLMVK